MASTIPSLTSPSSLNLRENLLETHDLELPIPSPSNDPKISTRRLRILLFSPSSCSPTALTNALSRIDRLAHKTGARDLAIVFLLVSSHSGAGSTSSNPVPTAAYAAAEPHAALAILQSTLLLDHPSLARIPLLPLPSPTSLAPLLQHYVNALTKSAPNSHPAGLQGSNGNSHPASGGSDRGSAVLSLLAQCTVRPPLSRQTVCVVADCVPSLKALARCAVVHDDDVGGGWEEGDREGGGRRMEWEVAMRQRERLMEFVGEEELAGMMEFWREEWVVE
ncbi:MAG: hypothetical protein M1822_002530 [Bathelium mastoideum]|nr:MAG: hypothetical protein M1822_002530 [Bathelium mastoideum]